MTRTIPTPADDRRITDAALDAFARWCRLNSPTVVLDDPVTRRRVFEAYVAFDDPPAADPCLCDVPHAPRRDCCGVPA